MGASGSSSSCSPSSARSRRLLCSGLPRWKRSCRSRRALALAGCASEHLRRRVDDRRRLWLDFELWRGVGLESLEHRVDLAVLHDLSDAFDNRFDWNLRRLRLPRQLASLEHTKAAAPIALHPDQAFLLARAQQIHQPAEAVAPLV